MQALLSSNAGSSGTFRNNIFYHKGTGTVHIANIISGQTWSDNIWYAPNASTLKWFVDYPNEYTTYSAWASASGETSGSYEDPKFTAPGSADYTLQSDSPAIDSASDVGITEDYLGYVRPEGVGYDVGAYEYGAQAPLNQLEVEKDLYYVGA